MAKKRRDEDDVLNRVSPAKMLHEIYRGYKRFEPDRFRARFTAKLSAGPAFISASEVKCDAPLPLLFNAARTLVPQLCINFPRHTVETPYLPARQYAQNLGLALSLYDKKQQIPNIYRCVIVDALHSLGILKTGIESGGTVLPADDDNEELDNGQIYTERVSFDNFVADPDCREYLFLDARFLGNIIRVPRSMLLESGQYDEDMVNQLPKDDSETQLKESTASLTMGNINANENAELEDIVKIAEIWIPSANAVVTVPGDLHEDTPTITDYLRVSDYYGVKEGPYTFLSLTIPIPDNPLPVPLMRILFQLEMAANRMATKIGMQADRQKDVGIYRAADSESAKKIVDAADGEMIQMDDPSSVSVLHFGGQQNSNEEHLNTILTQFNMLAANVETLSGVSSAAKSATAANILQQNSSIGLADMQNAVYAMAAGEARRRAFYIHTDPLMNVVLSKRVANPGQMQMGPMGQPQWLVPPTVQEIQEYLTPEQRTGDFLDLAFTIEPESMSRVDSKLRLQQEQTFFQQVLPAIMGAAQIAQGMGMAFDAAQAMWMMAKDMGIMWLDSVLFAPAIQQKAMMEYNAIQMATGEGVKPGQEQSGNPLQNAMLQNGQPGAVQAPQPGPMQQQGMQAQQGAQDSQRIIRQALIHGIGGRPATPALPTANAF